MLKHCAEVFEVYAVYLVEVEELVADPYEQLVLANGFSTFGEDRSETLSRS
jgi:hypothetical protein